MAQRKRKAQLKKPTKRELIQGSPPVPHVVVPKPKPTVWERFKRWAGW